MKGLKEFDAQLSGQRLSFFTFISGFLLYYLHSYLLGFLFCRYREWFEQRWLVIVCTVLAVGLLFKLTLRKYSRVIIGA